MIRPGMPRPIRPTASRTARLLALLMARPIPPRPIRSHLDVDTAYRARAARP